MKINVSKVKGGLFGLAAGDALGVPYEFFNRDKMSASPAYFMRADSVNQLPAGSWSDDTSLTLATADSLADGGDLTDMMEKFCRWFYDGDYTPDGKAFGVGQTTREAIKRYADEGIGVSQCGGGDDRENGNGSLMRIYPVAVYNYYRRGKNAVKDKTAQELLHNVSALTHAHMLSQMCCGVYAAVVYEALSGAGGGKAVKNGVRKALRVYSQRPFFKDLMPEFQRLSDKNFHKTKEDEIFSGGYVMDTLTAALWCVANTNNYRDCVLRAVNLGGDTDTTAAVAGAVAGTIYGFDNIPEDYRALILRADYISDIAQKFIDSLSQKNS